MSKASRYKYTLAGLKVGSEFPLPELLPLDYTETPDVQIRYSDVPESLPNGIRSMFEAQVAPGTVLLTIPDVARYYVDTGKEIRVEPFTGASDKDIRLFLLGSGFGAIYLQRGLFPLHASAAVINGEAVAFVGDSGAGKSTMAAWMSTQGYPLLCDDVCVISVSDDQPPMAFPAYPRMKLWKDALKKLGREVTGLQRDYSRTDKYHLSVDSMYRGQPVPLRQVFFLKYSDDASEPSLEEITPSHAVPLLRNNTYRFQFISGLKLTEQHFQDCISIARGVSVYALHRPRKLSALADCQRVIEDQLA